MGFMATNMQKIKVIDQFISKIKVKTHLPTDGQTDTTDANTCNYYCYYTPV